MADEITDAIESDALEPKIAEVDGVMVEKHPLRDQIAADKYLEGKKASRKSGGLGIKISRMEPPGAAG